MTDIPNDTLIRHGYYYFDDRTVKEMFDDKSSGAVKKFTY